jgi:O-antigen/teichoic acid export membrane protein
MTKLVRGSTLLLAGRFVAVGINFAVQVLLVRYLSKSDFGAFAYGLSIAAIGSSLAVFGLGKTFSRFVPIFQQRGRHREMIGTVVLVLGVVAGLGGALVLTVHGLRGVIAGSFVKDPLCMSLLLILIALAPLQAIENILEKMFAIFADPRVLFLRRYVIGPGLRLCAVLPLVVFHDNVMVLAMSYLIAGGLATVVSAAILVRVLRQQDLLRHFRRGAFTMPVRRILSFSAPLAFSDFVFLMRASLMTLLMEFFHGALGVAALRAVLPVARLNSVVLDSFKLLFTPAASRLYATGDRNAIESIYWRNAAWTAVITFPLFATLFALAEPVTTLLFGPRYADSAIVLSTLALGYYVDAAFGFNSILLRVYGRLRIILFNDLLAAMTAIGLGVWLVRDYGALGGAIATTSTLLVQNCLNQMALARIGAVRRIEWQFLRVYLMIAVVAVGLKAAQSALGCPLHVALPLVAAAALFVAWSNAEALDVKTTFPKLLLLPFAKQLLRVTEREA